MQVGIPLHPPQASTIAKSVDYLHFFLTGVTLFFTALIFLIIFIFMIKYRRRSPHDRPPQIDYNIPLEVLWTVIPTLLVAIIFFWGSSLYFRNADPPPGSMEIFVTGRQWMWKVEHPEGQREINELHVPINRPVKLTITSEDVIHDFYIPAFRVKKDAVPGRYTSLWFDATELGTFHIFCGQYCGAFHASMIGSVVVMQQDEYERWLASRATAQNMETAGQQLFAQYSCNSCHAADGAGNGPSLARVYGQPVHLSSGATILADDDYLRESIVRPAAKVVAGYQPVMPVYQGRLNEEQILDLIAYIRSLDDSGPRQEEAKK
jgi:cytochrome c oxidase subunit 2